MSNALIAHAPGDAASAVGVCAVTPGAEALLAEGPLTDAGARAPLMLLWSRNAVSHGAVFAQMALAQRGAVILCRLDDTPAATELAALEIVNFDGNLSGKHFLRAALGAFIEARRRGRVRVRAADAPSRDWSFAGGVARGLSSSVAMLSIGSLAAVAATDKVDQTRVIEDVLSLFGAPVTAEAADNAIAEEAGLPSYEGLRTIVATMQEQDVAQRQEIAERLEGVRRDLIESEIKTSHMLDQLDALSHRASWRDPAPQPSITIAASPRTLQEAANQIPPRTLTEAARMAAPGPSLSEAAKAQDEQFAALAERGAKGDAG